MFYFYIGRDKIVKLFIDRNALLDISDDDGQTPLLRAIMNGHENCIKLLLAENYSLLNSIDKRGNCPKKLLLEKFPHLINHWIELNWIEGLRFKN